MNDEIAIGNKNTRWIKCKMPSVVRAATAEATRALFHHLLHGTDTKVDGETREHHVKTHVSCFFMVTFHPQKPTFTEAH